MLKKHALAYQKLGWSVIPLKNDKKPYIEWNQYKHRRAGPEEIEQWFDIWPHANVGVVTGEISDLLVVDIETIEAQNAFADEFGGVPNTWRQATGKEHGLHLLFKHPKDGCVYHNQIRIKIGDNEVDIDTRGEGGYIMVSPSVHPTGKQYRWILGPYDVDDMSDLLVLPKEIRPIFKPTKEGEPVSKAKKNEEDWVQKALMGVKKGKRNEVCAKLAGFYLRKFKGDTEQTAMMMAQWNSRNSPPLDWKEVEKVIESIHSRQGHDELSETVGESIKKIQVLVYPDGTRKYNVFLDGCTSYAQMALKELGTFSLFKWRFGEMAGYIPAFVKQGEWEEKVNNALHEAELIRIAPDETPMGIVISTINSQIFKRSANDDPNLIDNRITLIGYNGEKIIGFKLEALINILRFEHERMGRKQVGEVLRKLGFINKTGYINPGNRACRFWSINFDQWLESYAPENMKFYNSLPEP